MVSKKLILVLSFLAFGFSFQALSQDKSCRCERQASVMDADHSCCSKTPSFSSHCQIKSFHSCICSSPLSNTTWFNSKSFSQEFVKAAWLGSSFLLLKRPDFNDFASLHFFKKFSSRPPITASLSFKQSFLI